MEMNETTVKSREQQQEWPMPVAAIFCLAILLYLLLLAVALTIRKCLMAHGIFPNCCPQVKSGPGCCPGSCTNCAQQCNWKMPTVDNCLDLICPTKQRVNCIEFLVCDWADVRCCNEGRTYTCGSGEYACTCEAPRCENINCLCCQISFRPT